MKKYEVQLFYHGNIVIPVLADDEEQAKSMAEHFVELLDEPEFYDRLDLVGDGCDIQEVKD